MLGVESKCWALSGITWIANIARFRDDMPVCWWTMPLHVAKLLQCSFAPYHVDNRLEVSGRIWGYNGLEISGAGSGVEWYSDWYPMGNPIGASDSRVSWEIWLNLVCSTRFWYYCRLRSDDISVRLRNVSTLVVGYIGECWNVSADFRRRLYMPYTIVHVALVGSSLTDMITFYAIRSFRIGVL